MWSGKWGHVHEHASQEPTLWMGKKQHLMPWATVRETSKKRRHWKTSCIERSLLAEYKSLLQERELALQFFQFMIHDKFDPPHKWISISSWMLYGRFPAHRQLCFGLRCCHKRARRGGNFTLPKAGPRNSPAADPNGSAVDSQSVRKAGGDSEFLAWWPALPRVLKHDTSQANSVTLLWLGGLAQPQKNLQKSRGRRPQLEAALRTTYRCH